jgi:hypothetical protein
LLVIGCVVVVLAAVAIGLVVSGGDDGTGSRAQRVATVDLASVLTGSPGTTAKTMVERKRTDGKVDRMEGEVDLGDRSVELRGPLGMDTGSDASDLPLDAMPEDVRMMFEVFEAADGLIAIGDHGYVHSQGSWWDLGSGMEEAEGGIDLFSPTSVLEQVAKLGKVAEVGTEEVRGVSATRYATTQASSGDRYDVWVDGDGRVVRLVQAYGDAEAFGLVSESIELFDFGTPVTIEVPPDAKPLDPFGGPGTTRSDVELREVATGSDHGLGWTLLTGELEDGRRCIAVRTDQDVDAEVVDLAADGKSSTSSDVGARTDPGASCGPESVLDAGQNGEHLLAVGSGARLLAVGGKRGAKHYLAGLLTEGADVTVTFRDGREEKLEDHDGAFILVFSGHDWPVEMSGNNATCELQGDKTMSGNDDVC